MHSHIGCICLTFLHCVFSNVSSNCLLERMQNHTGCICWTFHHCAPSNVSSNGLFEKLHNYIGCICVTCYFPLWLPHLHYLNLKHYSQEFHPLLLVSLYWRKFQRHFDWKDKKWKWNRLSVRVLERESGNEAASKWHVSCWKYNWHVVFLYFGLIEHIPIKARFKKSKLIPRPHHQSWTMPMTISYHVPYCLIPTMVGM